MYNSHAKFEQNRMAQFWEIKNFDLIFYYRCKPLINNAGSTGALPKAGENVKNRKYGPPSIGLGRTKLFAALESKGLLPQAYGLLHVAQQDWNDVEKDWKTPYLKKTYFIEFIYRFFCC